ncbi:MAG: hypothetical protein KBF17_02765 [Candidatus Promineofilum sp.]|nr:hypothetical protein [Promineifilum sp.]MBP9656264.1 hypothetical protein [Promineifilum sp.]
MAAHWYTLHVKPHKERFIHERLRSPEGLPYLGESGLGRPIDVFFPAVRVKPKNPRAAKTRPYFPGYLFVHADLEVLGENAFSWIPGAHGLVNFGGTPAIVPDALIHELRQRIVQIEEAGGWVESNLAPGDAVRIISGPFAGYGAIFDAQLPGHERVQVLLAFLSQHPQRIQLDLEDVEKIKKS